MIQSPYYGWNNRIENPIYYLSDDYSSWYGGLLLKDTPISGYNSDPNIFVEKDDIWTFWREVSTPVAISENVDCVTVGGRYTRNGVDSLRVFLRNNFTDGDVEQCPIIIKVGNKYRAYASWYQYSPTRENKGIAIWEGTSLDSPDFRLADTVRFKSPITVDKIKQLSFFGGGGMLFIPKHLRHDLWHFDLFEYDKKLWMVSVAEKGDNVMLSVSKDYRTFKTFLTPLINNHYSETKLKYRQYYYKPTAFVKNDSLFLFYTANAKDDSKRNQLFLSVAPMHKFE